MMRLSGAEGSILISRSMRPAGRRESTAFASNCPSRNADSAESKRQRV
jgi:hypothetical protein